MTNDKITITQCEYEHRLRMAHEDGYQEGLYDGIVHAARNSQPAGKRMVAHVHMKDGKIVAAAIDSVAYDETLYYFLQQTGRR